MSSYKALVLVFVVLSVASVVAALAPGVVGNVVMYAAGLINAFLIMAAE